MYLLPIVTLAFIYVSYYVIYSDMVKIFHLYSKTSVFYIQFFQTIISSLLTVLVTAAILVLFYYLVAYFFKKIPERFNASWRAGHYNTLILIDFEHNQI